MKICCLSTFFHSFHHPHRASQRMCYGSVFTFLAPFHQCPTCPLYSNCAEPLVESRMCPVLSCLCAIACTVSHLVYVSFSLINSPEIVFSLKFFLMSSSHLYLLVIGPASSSPSYHENDYFTKINTVL